MPATGAGGLEFENLLCFPRNLLRLLRSDVDLSFFMGRCFEVSDGFAQVLSDLGQLASPKNDHDDDEDD